MPTEKHTTVQIGSKHLTLYKFTGKVADAQKHLETRVSGGGGGGGTYRGTGGTAPVSITSTTVTHDNLFLIDKEGHERALQLQGFNVACRPSHIITALWAIPNGKESGHYYAVINHTTDTTFFSNTILNEVVTTCVNPLGNKYLGCFALFFVGIICLFFPMLFMVLIGYIIYFFVSVKNGVSKIKANSKVNGVEPW